jgi:hypothetical protein
MDARYFREKAEVLFRLADGLSLNNLGRFQLMALAEDLGRRAKELEAQVTLQQQQFDSPVSAGIHRMILSERTKPNSGNETNTIAH